jgi:hypothetical protein
MKLSVANATKSLHYCYCYQFHRFSHYYISDNVSRDSLVGIATGYELDDQGVGVRVPVGVRIFTSPSRPDRHWGPPNLLSNRYRGLFPPGVERPGREAEHLRPTSAEVKENMYLYIHSPICLHGVVLN